MTDRLHERLVRRARDGRAIIALARDGVRFGLFTQGDQRRRPALTFDRAALQGLQAAGLIEKAGRAVFRIKVQALPAPPEGSDMSLE